MKIIFLSMTTVHLEGCRGIYVDLLRKFKNEGHQVLVVSPCERRLKEVTNVYEEDGVRILSVRSLNLQKSSIIEKGFGQLLIERQFKTAIKKYWAGEKVDLIVYSTPPITLVGVINYLKHHNPQAKTYLLLKDIFPQNAVDVGLLTLSGLKGIIYRFYRRKEKELYKVSDFIGCMSPANVRYLLTHNQEISPVKVEVAPNSISLLKSNLGIIDEKELEQKYLSERNYIRKKYDIPIDRPVFIYGGNLGKPQGIPFLIDCLSANASRKDCFIVVIGTGTELPKLKTWYSDTNPRSVKVMDGLPKSDYDVLVRACDAGMIFLDHRFTIPNYPSRLLSYLENKMPVICATDPNSDMGRIAEENGFGYWCESNSVIDFTIILDKMIHSDRKSMGENGYEYLKKNYLVDNTYNAIMSHV